MKKLIALALSALMLLGMLAGCAAKGTQNNTDYSSMTLEELIPLIETINEGKLTMVTSPDFAPYEFYALDENDNPTLAGFDIALAQYIADKLGSWRSSPWILTAPSRSLPQRRQTSAWPAIPLTLIGKALWTSLTSTMKAVSPS